MVWALVAVEESRSESEKAPEGQDSSDPPGAVSNQNQEEAESGHAQGAGEGAGGEGGGESSDPGAASEGSQATGHPENAG
jgi:hypothetical protein